MANLKELTEKARKNPKKAFNRFKLSRELANEKKTEEALLHSLAAIDNALAKGTLKPQYVEHAMKLLVRSRMPKLAEIVGLHATNVGVNTPKVSLRMAQAISKQRQWDAAVKWIDHGLSLGPKPGDKSALEKFRIRAVSKR